MSLKQLLPVRRYYKTNLDKIVGFYIITKVTICFFTVKLFSALKTLLLPQLQPQKQNCTTSPCLKKEDKTKCLAYMCVYIK